MQLLSRSLLALSLALVWSCHDDPTYTVIELQSDLGAELTRVEVVIRDEQDRDMSDHYSFDADVTPEYRVPFSFVIEPRARADQAVVITATGYSRSELLSESKLRVRLARGKTSRHVLPLMAACRGMPSCPAGQTCDPESAQCGDIPEEYRGRADGSVRARAAMGGAGGLSETAGMEQGGAGGEMDMPDEPVAGHAADGGASGRAPRADAGASGADGGRGAAAVGGKAGRAAAGGGGGAAGMQGAGGHSGSGGGELNGSANADVSYQGQAYVVASNVYGGGEQTLQYESTSFKITRQTGDNPAGVAFFSVFVGSQYYKTSPGSPLPLPADKVESIQIAMTTNAGDVPGTYQALSALWFSAGPEVDGNLPTGGYLEVWYHVQTPHNPAGRRVASAVSFRGAAGSYDVWQGTCNGRPCTTYVRTDAVSSYAGDLMPFLQDALERPNGVDASWYLNAVFCGFDVAAGGEGLSASAISEHVR